MSDDSSNGPNATAPNVRPLFRQHAVEHAGTRQYGTVILARPVSYRFITALFAAIGAALISFFILFSTTRKAQCDGRLLPIAGVTQIISGQSGVITSKRILEGQLVHAGDVLFVLSSERSSATDESTQKTISRLMQKRREGFNTELQQLAVQSRQRILAASRRAEDLSAEVTQFDQQIVMQQKRIDLAEQSFKRFNDLQEKNYISPSQVQDKQADLIDQRQRLAELQRQQAATRRDLVSAQDSLRDLAIQANRDANALQRNAAEIEQDLTANEARREILVRAPQDGLMTGITTELGQTVASTTVLASLLPSGSQLEAEIFAPSRSAGFVRIGMPVLLRYQAYPYEKFGQYTARIKEISNTALSPQELGVGGGAGKTAEPVYRIRLQLDSQHVLAYGKQMPLKSGMLVDASIVLEQRKLYEWILEPLFSISGRI